jgi:hypothetical protein
MTLYFRRTDAYISQSNEESLMSIVINRPLANAAGPRRLTPLVVRPHDGPYRASLLDTAQGVLVRLSRDDRPRGKRFISAEVIDAPLHVVADRLHSMLAELNR